MRVVAGLLSGLVFGIGLVISGMINPAKILNFLDLAGTWDPSLAFVMAGAVAVTLVGYRLVQASPKPVFAERFEVPTRRDIDTELVVGAAVFGLGWGLGGYCPGPGVTALALGEKGTIAFVVFVLAGMWMARVVKRRFGDSNARSTI